MPSNKTSLYDGSVTIIGGSLDLTGQVGLADGAITKGDATITVDTGTYDWVVGNEVYGCESSGEGAIKHIGTISSITGNTGTRGGSDLDVTLTLVEPAKISAADNSVIVNVLPKFEIVAIQIVKSGALTELVPARNYYVGTRYSDGITSWSDSASVDYFGAASGAAGDGWSLTTTDLEVGITIEGRWKKATVSSGDCAICLLKSAPSRGIKGATKQGY